MSLQMKMIMNTDTDQDKDIDKDTDKDKDMDTDTNTDTDLDTDKPTDGNDVDGIMPSLSFCQANFEIGFRTFFFSLWPLTTALLPQLNTMRCTLQCGLALYCTVPVWYGHDTVCWTVAAAKRFSRLCHIVKVKSFQL